MTGRTVRWLTLARDDDGKDGEAVMVAGEQAGATVVVQWEETECDVPRGRIESGFAGDEDDDDNNDAEDDAGKEAAAALVAGDRTVCVR